MSDVQIIEVQVPGIPGPLGPTGSLQNTYPVVTRVSGQTYTLLASDLHKLISFTSDLPVTVTLPASLVEGWTAVIVQKGAGSVKLVPASGAQLRHPDGHNGTELQFSTISLAVEANVGGSAADYVLGGRTTLIP
jgi:hypothetical protein